MKLTVQRTLLVFVLVGMAMGLARVSAQEAPRLPAASSIPQASPIEVPPSNELSALLAEVRALRTELNQFATTSIRVQLFMGRLQLQEQRIRTLSQQIVDTRAELTKVSQELDRAQADLDEFARGEHPIQRQQHDVDHDKIVAMTGIEIRKAVEQRQKRIQELRTQEANLSGDLSIEQTRWSDFNTRLDELDSTLPRR